MCLRPFLGWSRSNTSYQRLCCQSFPLIGNKFPCNLITPFEAFNYSLKITPLWWAAGFACGLRGSVVYSLILMTACTNEATTQTRMVALRCVITGRQVRRAPSALGFRRRRGDQEHHSRGVMSIPSYLVESFTPTAVAYVVLHTLWQ